jgi:hypothetical protein
MVSINDAVMDNQNWVSDANILRQFFDAEVFFELLNAPASLGTGAYVASEDDEMRIRFTNVEGKRMALFYTTKENSNLTAGKIGGVPLRAAIDMVIDCPSVDGLLLHSNQEIWRAVTKEGLEHLLRSI